MPTNKKTSVLRTSYRKIRYVQIMHKLPKFMNGEVRVKLEDEEAVYE